MKKAKTPKEVKENSGEEVVKKKPVKRKPKISAIEQTIVDEQDPVVSEQEPIIDEKEEETIATPSTVPEVKPIIQFSKYLMFLSTAKGVSVKTLAESLKEVLTDVNIHFNSQGLSVVNMDPRQISFVSLELIGSAFEAYYCPNNMLLGVNMLALYKLLKTIGNNDILSLYVTKDDPVKLGINIQNKHKRINNNITYNLLDVDLLQIDIPEIEYDAHITMPCGDFQKYCRELATISNFVTLYINSDKVFSMKVDGKFASQTLNIEESTDSKVVIKVNENIENTNKEILIGTYSLKFLNLFCKSSTLCPTIQLYIKADFPIIITYSVSSLGTVKYCLCCVNDTDD